MLDVDSTRAVNSIYLHLFPVSVHRRKENYRRRNTFSLLTLKLSGGWFGSGLCKSMTISLNSKSWLSDRYYPLVVNFVTAGWRWELWCSDFLQLFKFYFQNVCSVSYTALWYMTFWNIHNRCIFQKVIYQSLIQNVNIEALYLKVLYLKVFIFYSITLQLVKFFWG